MSGRDGFNKRPMGRVVKEAPVELDLSTNVAISKALAPTPENFKHMIRFVCERKYWSQHFYATLLNIPHDQIIRILKGLEVPKGAVARLIWLFYILDVAPAFINEPAFIIAWGQTEVELPRWADKKKAGVTIREVLAGTKLMSKAELKRRCAEKGVIIEERSIRTVTEQLNYRFGTNIKSRRGHHLFKPTGIWMNVDWKKRTSVIAKQYGISASRVQHVKTKLRRLPKNKVLQALVAAGRSPEVYDDLMRRHRHFPKSSQTKPVAAPKAESSPESLAPSPQSISETGNTSENRMDVCAEIACQSPLSGPSADCSTSQSSSHTAPKSEGDPGKEVSEQGSP